MPSLLSRIMWICVEFGRMTLCVRVLVIMSHKTNKNDERENLCLKWFCQYYWNLKVWDDPFNQNKLIGMSRGITAVRYKITPTFFLLPSVFHPSFHSSPILIAPFLNPSPHPLLHSAFSSLASHQSPWGYSRPPLRLYIHQTPSLHIKASSNIDLHSFI